MRSARNSAVFLLCCSALRADFSYQSRIQFDGGVAVSATRLIKGHRMAVLTRQHTSVIDLDAETITEIDFAKKTYSVTPFAEMKKTLADAAAGIPQETSFKVSVRPPTADTKPVGIVNSVEHVVDIAGVSGALNITVDSWVATLPGYEQMNDFTTKLAAKMGYVFASGLAPMALTVPKSWQGFEEAAKQLSRSRGAPLQSTIKVSGPDGQLAEASIELSSFGGGIQDASKFAPPAGFKKVSAP